MIDVRRRGSYPVAEEPGDTMTIEAEAARGAAVPAWTYAYCAAVGALAGTGVVGLLTVGIVLLVAAGLLALVGVLVLRLPAPAFVGTVGGLAVAPLYLAWLNRGGPGNVCTPFEGGEEYTEMWSPWPFAAGALALLVGCLLLARGQRAGR